MTIYHIVLFKFKSLVPVEEVNAVCGSELAWIWKLVNTEQACDRMLALKTNCKHPETQQEYVRTSIGGSNNSPEDAANGFTHAFISEFENDQARKFYLEKDPAHLEFVKRIDNILEKHQVIDFSPGVF
ncbi:uncharacterized protein JN550_011572 [Neoarthrinium moseri]|uniref:uncharacterized protein n=1 Tax=Neoarthrinium moseri TaxID=1658444 RepID=UPI001FDBCCF4|nr:uncharacterized protein JN550_011572 [Neoarthrinium moseri]KAI1860306.1 hypothetical protein JN550_011572 [Neoarthrinium moseri]